MLKLTGRFFILLVVIGLVTTAVITLGNAASSTTEFTGINGSHEFQSDLKDGSNQPHARPEFMGAGHEYLEGGVFMAADLIKNLVIMAVITFIVTLIRKGLRKFQTRQPAVYRL